MPHKTLKKPSHPPFSYYFIASSLTAAFENFVFFPIARMAALQQYKTLKKPATFAPDIQSTHANTMSYRSTLASIYKGLWPNILYRITQRNIMYAGQPIIQYNLNAHIGDAVEEHVGKQYRNPILASTAGIMSSLLEIFFLPLSTISIRMQTQHYTFKEAIATGHLYNGSTITAMRNMQAATILYGFSSYLRQYFNAANPQNISFLQELIAASGGSFVSTLLSHPLDTVKTCQQATHSKQSALTTVEAIWRHYGYRGFMSGLVPRLSIAAPRTAFTMTATNQFVKGITALSEQGLFAKTKPFSETRATVEEMKKNRPSL